MKPRALITCNICGRQFKVWPYRLKRVDGVVKYCSKECYWKSRVGMKVSDETKKKMSDSHGRPTWLDGQIVWNKGKHGLQIAWNKGRTCEQFRGDKHWNWRGGITSEVRRIRNSTEYKNWRKSVFKRDNFTCQICFKVGGEIQADHIKPFCLFPELRLDLDNGRTLCYDCHKNTDTYMRGALKYV